MPVDGVEAEADAELLGQPAAGGARVTQVAVAAAHIELGQGGAVIAVEHLGAVPGIQVAVRVVMVGHKENALAGGHKIFQGLLFGQGEGTVAFRQYQHIRVTDGGVSDDRFVGVAVGGGWGGVVVHKLDNAVAVLVHTPVFLHRIAFGHQRIGEVGKGAVDHPVRVAFGAPVGHVEQHHLAVVVGAGGLDGGGVVPLVGMGRPQ